MMPAAASCRPRCATGRAVSQSRADIRRHETSNKPSTSTAASAGSAATPTVVRAWRPLSPKTSTIEIGGAVHHLGAVKEGRRGIDEAAEPHDAHDLVEIAERGLDLGQQVDRAGARGLLAVLDRDVVAELALGDELAVGAEADSGRTRKAACRCARTERSWRPALAASEARYRVPAAWLSTFAMMFSFRRLAARSRMPRAPCTQFARAVFADREDMRKARWAYKSGQGRPSRGCGGAAVSLCSSTWPGARRIER